MHFNKYYIIIDVVKFLSILSFVENFKMSLLLTLFHFIQFGVLMSCCKTTNFLIKVSKGHLDAIIVKHEKLSLKLIEVFR